MQKLDARTRYHRKCRNLVIASLAATAAIWFTLLFMIHSGTAALHHTMSLPVLIILHLVILIVHLTRRQALDRAFGFEERQL
ncbi:hypothetical protein [Nitratireductor basaltis]|uniref:Uncharacterized protein n=1 Tax=Nitratireductor basaltis TaxID=472175 RepID=A0A084UAH5_9HYPH|nr:hypothetical protein [Nitratireductor basaltis]KFB09961.1 hypothetical protein EL18_00988 [Nitratireductor basaltis]